MNVGSAFNGGGVAGYGYDTSNAAGSPDHGRWRPGRSRPRRPAVQPLPKTGGNTFSGTYFGNIAGKWSQGDNVDDELRSFGIPTPPALIRSWDTSFSMGGPIMRDHMWFYGIVRGPSAHTPDIAGRFANANAGDPTRWDYVSRSWASRSGRRQPKIGGVARHGSADAENKVGVYYRLPEGLRRQPYTQDGEQCREPR